MQKLFKPPSAIVYSKDFEPISHIPMTDEIYRYFMQYDIVRFPVQKAVDAKVYYSGEPIPMEPPLTAEIRAMRVFSPDGIRLILIAETEETALLLRNTFLPGQTKELNYIKTTSFVKGFINHAKLNK
jgi:hypothetical protein